MAIVINGSGTVTGISVGGLPDDIVDAGMMADNSIDSDAYVDASIDNAHLADDAVGVAELSATGTASSSTFLRGDNSWATAGVAGISSSADATAITIASNETVTLNATGSGNYSDAASKVLKTAGTQHTILSVETSSTGGHNAALELESNGNPIQFSTSGSNELSIQTSGAEAFKIDSTGAVTKPLQPAFSVNMSAVQSNIAASTEVTIQFDTEIFDVNADFNTSTYTFTAPVTGKYLLTLATRLQAVQNDSTYIVVKIKTSNREYSNIEDVTTFVGDADYWTPSVAAVADMDANDTAYAIIYASASGNEIDVGNSAAYTKFSGILLA